MDAIAVNIDIIGFDACLMGMVEVAYQLEGNADIILGSEELEPGDGWPYDTILTELVVTPTMSSSLFASKIVDAYYASQPYSTTTLGAFYIDEVANVSDKAGIGKKVCRLIPMGVVKG